MTSSLESIDTASASQVEPAGGRRAGRAHLAPAGAALSGAAGLAIISASFALSRTGHAGTGARALFWLGLVVVLSPIAALLLSQDTSRRDRLLLLVALGLLTYAVKVLHDPLTFLLGDELVHAAAAQHLASGHVLGQAFADQGVNVALDYPGLQLLAVAVVRTTGLSLFVSGLITIGLARVLMLLAVFVLVEKLTQSDRVAGIAALVFAANSNFLFWSAQFSYESLALPLYTVALAVIVARGQSEGSRRAVTAVIAVLIAAITVTHHLTAFALALSLWFVTLCSLRERWRAYRSFWLAVFATAAATVWLLLAAPETRAYLGYIVQRTVTGITQVLQGGGRTPFQSASTTAPHPPLVEEVVSYLAVALLGVWVVAALWRHRVLGLLRSPGHLLLALGSLGFLALFALRLSPGSWETANRGQEFLFAGPAMLVALGAVELLRRSKRPRRLARALVAGMLLVICGGVIQGWEAGLLLPPPLDVDVHGATIRPQGLVAASWSIQRLGPAMRYMADEASGRELLVRGAVHTFFGATEATPEVLHDAGLPAWQRTFLKDNAIDYVLLDRRQISTDPDAGYYFATAAQPASGQGYYSLGAQRKFAVQPMVSTIFDSGDIKIYDIRGLWQSVPPCASVGLASATAGVTCVAGHRELTFGGDQASVALPRGRIRYLATDVVRSSPTAAVLTAVVQFQNFGPGAVVASPRPGSISLRLPSGRIRRLASLRLRHDNLGLRRRIAAGASLQGSISFAVKGRRAVRALARSKGYLYVQAPSAPASPAGSTVAVFNLGRARS